MKHEMEGRAHKYGDNINTDIISPPAYMELSIKEAAAYAMYPVDMEFAAKFRSGDILVAGRNFGSGSSRETAPLCLKECGVTVILAKSFARIFYRNAINLGILAVECQETDQIEDGDVIRVALEEGVIWNITRNETYLSAKMPEHILRLVKAGGLIPYIRSV